MITLALAVAVRGLASRGAVVKRLSAVETLGSTDVICTDKTGTLTENRMRPVSAWTWSSLIDLESEPGDHIALSRDAAVTRLVQAALACNNARLDPSDDNVGDPTEIALLQAGQALGASSDAEQRGRDREAAYHFDPRLKLMSTADAHGDVRWLHTKGAPEAVLENCSTVLDADGNRLPLDDGARQLVAEQVTGFAAKGLRVIALADRPLPVAPSLPGARRPSAGCACSV